MMKELYHSLLKEWCDAMVAHQVTGTGIDGLDGGLYCTACGGVHGRSPDAAYPLLYMADKTGDVKYLNAAKALFDWGAQLLCEDGSYYNDHNGAWNGITVFMSTSTYEALHNHGHILDKETYAKWDARLRKMADWLYRTITVDFKTNVNYLATNAGAMAVLGKFYDNKDYLARAKELADKCLALIGEDGLFIGEGKPMDYVTKRGCRAVDVGYNVEESLPMLALYAKTIGDDAAYLKVLDSVRGHIRLMLPDGAWDNSFGTRTFKWTYWGSRTSDGFQEACAVLGRDDPMIAKAAWLNAELFRKTTHGGLLHGGPHYHAHGEKPCMHHTICHAKALAAVLDADVPEPGPSVTLPEPPAIAYFKEVDTYKLRAGAFRATVTGYDFDYMRGGHASGGTMTLLWHEKAGPLVASSMTDYSMGEPNNQQLPLKVFSHRTLTPRVELERNGTMYRNCYDFSSRIAMAEENGKVVVNVDASLSDIAHNQDQKGGRVNLTYIVSDGEVVIKGRVYGQQMENARYILPLIGLEKDGCNLTVHSLTYPANGAAVDVQSASPIEKADSIFFLAGGFEAWELTVKPDASGCFALTIQVK